MNAKQFTIAALTLVGLFSTGCASIAPGKTEAIQPVAAVSAPRVGQAYLFRGFIGIFSTGMNSLGDELTAQGVTANVFQADQWATVADTIADRYQNKNNAEPIVLVGHSYGADNIVRIAQRLKDKNVKIDLLVTLDPVTPPKVPANVKKVINLYQSNGIFDAMPWLRGIPLEQETPGAVQLANLNIRTDRTDLLTDGLNHFNIEKTAPVHAEVIKQVEQVCVTRPVWAAMKAPTRPVPMQAAAVSNGNGL
ncbi:MAG: AcvB/VirJ family lysyl-phosphatidylglycerol hydrolase [Tepidisphaeraceae bacterium]